MLGAQDITWKCARRRPERKTSPEDLIAAAHASCFAMALSHELAQAGTPAEELKTSATVTFQPGEGITRIALTVARPRSRASTSRRFLKRRKTAKENCPVSKALAGVPDITLEARLEG